MQFLSDNPALRSHLESQVDFINEFSQKAFDTARQLNEMNLKLARQTIEGSLHASRELLGCTDPVQYSQAAMKQLQPATERIRSWQEHLLRVLAGAQADFTHAAEARIPEASRSAGAVADELVRHAAAGVTSPLAASEGNPAGKPH
ncbi:TIGR01841 family phasin [Massilia sp. R2A-15]|uniref:TIGR01841 family phasin n=1 Tax=Massilia sp. R2A-15 TaxID=3064278 RepID=UPI002734C923|nr:TIGR01841 family phasin [Massilia sp. R2A-15]WLI90482.1 TIGR01841 family phasin [Massilia sp. R2A-15]